MIPYAWLIPLLPLVAAAAVGLIGRRGNRWAGYITIGAVLSSCVLSLRILLEVIQFPGPHQFSFPWLATAGGLLIPAGFLVDPLSSLMLVIVCFVALMVQIYSLGYMAGDEGLARYFAFLSLFTFSMLGLVLANNLVWLYMFWELVGLCSYLLIGFWYHKPEAANAAKKAFVVTRFGDVGFLIGILMTGYFLNTFNLLEIGQAAQSGKITGALALAMALLIFSGAAGKSAQFPLHVWLPDAMEGPTPVSALIHAATMVAAGVFLVARLFPVFVAAPSALTVVAYIGGFTALFSATIACVQDDIKRILAYSTISQLGYMMMALGCSGYAAGMFHLTTHAAYKALLFLAAGSVIHAVHTNNIWEMGGLLRRLGVTAAAMLVAALALAGIFPFSGFFSKDEILLAVQSSGHWDLLAVGLVTALLTAFYIFRLFFVVFAGKSKPGEHAHESPAVMTWPMLLLAVLAAGLGVLSKSFGPFLQGAFGAPHLAGPETSRLLPIMSMLMALLGMAWAYLVYFQRAISANLLMRRFAFLHTLVKNKYYVDEFYLLLVRNVMFVFSRGLAWFDRNVVDGAVNGVAWLCRQTGQGLSRLQWGRLQVYLLIFTLGVVVIGALTLVYHPVVQAWMK